MKIMKQLNNKGSILQIVLVIFIVITSSMTISLSVVRLQTRSYKDIEILMKQKNLEILLVKYYIDTIEKSVLISDYMESNDYSVGYTVDDMGSYYAILTKVSMNEINYSFYVEINVDDLEIQKLEYGEE